MPDFYSEMAKVARDLLGTFQQGAITLDVYTPGTGGSPHNPTPGTYTAQKVTATARGVREFEADALVQVTDTVVVMPPDVTPKLADRVTIDGVQHVIVKIDRKPQAGTVVAWLVYVRR